MNTIESMTLRAKVLFAASVLGIALSASTGMSAEPAKKVEPSRTDLQQKLEEAQKRLDTAAREIADLSMSLSDDVLPRGLSFMGGNPQRAMLGVNIGSRRGSDDREDGVEIVSVSPGGAAAEAGLRAGDVLTQINGKALKRDGEESPREKLLAAMSNVSPEQKVAVNYLREGKSLAANVVAQPVADRMFSIAVPGAPFPGAFPGPGGGPLPRFAFMRADGVFGAAELVPLTPKLGQYFGADKGLLVVRAPADERLKLEEGDVIVDIDGRVPSSATHALRILGSYQAGEQLKLNVLRMKKRLSFDITIPQDQAQRDMGRSNLSWFRPGDMAIPAPFAAPGAPAAVRPMVGAVPDETT